MKIFQIKDGFCYWDATFQHPTLSSTQGLYAPDIIFIEAPDYVREGWGFDSDQDGDARFIKPKPPEGWIYDDITGTYHPEGEMIFPSEPDVIDKLAAAYLEGVDEA